MSAPWMPPLPEPWDYAYEWDSPIGVTRKFSYARRNGRVPDRSVVIYTAAQMRQAHADAARAALEQASQVCRQRASRWKNRPVPMLGIAAELDDAADAIRALAKEITP